MGDQVDLAVVGKDAFFCYLVFISRVCVPQTCLFPPSVSIAQALRAQRLHHRYSRCLLQHQFVIY